MNSPSGPQSNLDAPQAALREIHAYVSRDNPEAADKLGAAFFSRTGQLREQPFLGRRVPELKRNNLREVIQGNYRIIYRVIRLTAQVEILRIWHGARGKPDVRL